MIIKFDKLHVGGSTNTCWLSLPSWVFSTMW